MIGKKYKNKKFFPLFAAALFCFTFFAKAQEDNEAILVATVNIYNAQIVSQDNNNFKLIFDLSNEGNIQPDVIYLIRLVKTEKDTQIIEDEKIYPENLTLNENQAITKEVEYTAPSYLHGEYELYAVAQNQSGLELSANLFGKINLTKTVDGFLNIIPGSCYLKSDKGKDKTYAIEKDEKLTAYCTIENSFNEKITFVPRITVYQKTIVNEPISIQKDENSELTINLEEKKEFYFNLPQIRVPQFYNAKLELLNEQGQPISNSSTFQYSIKGTSASIQNLRLDKDYYKKGDMAKVSFYWIAQGNDKISINLSIKNGNNESCADTMNQELNISNITPELTLPITKECRNPKIKASIQDEKGDILDKKDIVIKSSVPKTTQTRENIINYFIVFLIGLLSISLIAVLFKKRKLNRGIAIFAFLIFAGGLFGTLNRAKAYTATIGGGCATVTYGVNRTSFYEGDVITTNVRVTRNNTNAPCDGSNVNSILSWVDGGVIGYQYDYNVAWGTTVTHSFTVGYNDGYGAFGPGVMYDVNFNVKLLSSGDIYSYFTADVPITVTTYQCQWNGSMTPISCRSVYSGDTSMVPNDSTYWTYATTNTSAKCQFQCASGCSWNGERCACAATSWSPNPNTVCLGTTFTQTSNCSTTRSATGTKNCPASYSCIGSPVANSSYYSGDDTGLTSNVISTYSSTDTGAKCEYNCDSGYTYNGSSCDLYLCIGTIPTNATMYANDNLGLAANTAYTYSDSNTGAKCEYKCDNGYSWNSSNCIAAPDYNWREVAP